MRKLTTSGLYSFENMKKNLNLTCLMLLNKLRAVVLNNTLRDFAKSSCMECTHQESQIHCSSQKLAALHFITKIITAQAGEKEEAQSRFCYIYLGGGINF